MSDHYGDFRENENCYGEETFVRKYNNVKVKIGDFGVFSDVSTVEIYPKKVRVCWNDQTWQAYPKNIVRISFD